MDDTTILGATLGQLGQTVKKAVQQAVKMPEEMAQDVGGQVTNSSKQNEAQAASAKGFGEPRWQSDEERVKFLRDLYGSAQPSSESNVGRADQTSSSEQNLLKESAPSADAKAMADKEEQKRLLELRSQLHKENYYDPTFNPVKNPPAGGEERPAEKVEQEKKQEMAELQQKEAEKPPPLAVTREQNKAEMFRGTSG